MTRFDRGLVIGKFYPLHAGHGALIRAALSQCDHVTVEVLGGSTESVTVAQRAEWVREEHPSAHVVSAVDDAEIDFESAAAWDHHTAKIRSLLGVGGRVDAVFTSDAYGEELARRLGASWVRVDPGRTSTPVSGTAVRVDLPGHWWALPAPVRQHLAKRVVVVGAESTGTTTLARELAGHFGTVWVAEYGREWTEDRPGGIEGRWHTTEFDLVAAEQARREDDAARRAPRPLLIADTDVLATAVWHERYVGTTSPSVERLAARRVPDLYLLTDSDIPFVDDGMRDGEHLRPWMTRRFRERLAAQPAPWTTVSGSREERLAHGIRAIEDLLAAGWPLAPSLEQQQQARRSAASEDGTSND